MEEFAMHEPKVLMVGLPDALAVQCEVILAGVFPGATFAKVDSFDPEHTGHFDFALAGCFGGTATDGVFNKWIRAVEKPVCALVDTFDPASVNRLISLGADQVIPASQVAELLEQSIWSLPGFTRVRSANLGSQDAIGTDVTGSERLEKALKFNGYSQSVLDRMPVMVIVLDREGRILFFNVSCEQISGYSRDEVLGKFLADVALLPEQKQNVKEVISQVATDVHAGFHQNAWLTKDGTPRQIYWSNTRIGDESGEFEFILGMGMDITGEVINRSYVHELENRFRRIFQASPVGIGLIRYRDLTVIDVNDRLLRMYGRDRADFVGKPADQIGLLPERGARDLFEELFNRGPIHEREWHISLRERKPLFVLVSMELIEWANEISILMIAQDITERVHADEKVRRMNEDLERRILERTRALDAVNREKQAEVEYRKAMDAYSQRLTRIIWESSDVIAICEPGGRFQYINKAGRGLLKISESDPISHLHVQDLYPPDMQERLLTEVYPQGYSKGIWRGEIDLLLPGENRITVSQMIMAHLDSAGEIAFFSTIIRDISEEKKNREQVRLAYQAEKELNLLRTSFFSMTSHQFRTPLSTILSSAEILEHYAGNWSEEKRTFHLHRIEEQAQLLNEMLNAILEIGRLDLKAHDMAGGTVSLEMFDVCALVENCLKSHADNDGGRHHFNLTCPSTSNIIASDPGLVNRILDNLISNSVKYSNEGTQIDVAVQITDGWVAIEVQDEGIGILDEDKSMLTQPFFRASNTGSRPGSGLGLMIVKRSLDLIGGEMAIESKVDQGTCVSVRIPVRRRSDDADSRD